MSAMAIDPILLEVLRNRLDAIADEMELTLLKSAASPDREGGPRRLGRALQHPRRDHRPGGGHPDPPGRAAVRGPAHRRAPSRPEAHARGRRLPAERPLRRRHPPARHHPGGAGVRRRPGGRAGLHDVPPPGRGRPHARAACRRTPPSSTRKASSSRPPSSSAPASWTRTSSACSRATCACRTCSPATSWPRWRRGGSAASACASCSPRTAPRRVLAYIEELLARAERLTRAQIEAIPDGDYAFEDWLDDDGVDIGRPVKIAVTLRVRGSAMTFDFTGSDPQVRGPFNSVPASTMSAVYYAVRAISDASIPNNGGCFRAVDAVLPGGHDREPAAAGAGELPHRHHQAHRRHHPGRARRRAARPHAGGQLRHAARDGLRRPRPRDRPARSWRASWPPAAWAPGPTRTASTSSRPTCPTA